MQFNTSFNIHDISVIGFAAGDKQCSLGRFGRAQLIAGNRDIQVGAVGQDQLEGGVLDTQRQSFSQSSRAAVETRKGNLEKEKPSGHAL